MPITQEQYESVFQTLELLKEMKEPYPLLCPVPREWNAMAKEFVKESSKRRMGPWRARACARVGGRRGRIHRSSHKRPEIQR